ncbi:MAG: helix-turn-helix domain-containing protein [Rhodospirillales bacterium]
MTDAICFTIPAAVAASGIGRSAIYQALADGRLKAKKNGRRTLILKTDLERFLESLPDYGPDQAA